MYVQYWRYMKQVVLHFNFGYSYQNSQPVRQEIFSRLPATISLTVGAVIVWLAIGFPIGIISAIRSRTLLDRMTMGGALLAISAPVYWLGLVGLYLFANDIGVIKIFDGAGTYTGLTADPPRVVRVAAVALDGARRQLRRVLRPVAAVEPDRGDVRGLHPHGAGQGPVRAPRDLAPWRALRDHADRHVLGLDIGTLLGGAILTETVFNIPGIGRLAYEGIINADLPVIQGTVLFGAFFIVIANLVVDIAYAFLDPRVRYS